MTNTQEPIKFKDVLIRKEPVSLLGNFDTVSYKFCFENYLGTKFKYLHNNKTYSSFRVDDSELYYFILRDSKTIRRRINSLQDFLEAGKLVYDGKAFWAKNFDVKMADLFQSIADLKDSSSADINQILFYDKKFRQKQTGLYYEEYRNF